MATPTTQDERSLVEAAQADPERFLDLFDRFFPRVWGYVIRRTENRTDAEDVTSEVFRKALENLPMYEWRGAPFFAWLMRIASNALSHRWEKSVRETGDPPPEVAEPDANLERQAMLFQLIDRLPEAQRRVIELRFVEGRSLMETAESMGTSEGAIKQLQRRAIETLRADLEGNNA